MVFRNLELDENWQYRGKPAAAPVVDLAIGYSGSLQFELIQQLNDAPSGFADHRGGARGDAARLAPVCLDRGVRRRVEQLRRHGLEIVHEGRIKGAPHRAAYFERPRGGWPHIEISEVRHPDMLPAVEHIERLNAEWDGSTPAVIEVMDLAGMGTALGLS